MQHLDLCFRGFRQPHDRSREILNSITFRFSFNHYLIWCLPLRSGSEPMHKEQNPAILLRKFERHRSGPFYFERPLKDENSELLWCSQGVLTMTKPAHKTMLQTEPFREFSFSFHRMNIFTSFCFNSLLAGIF
ncbi:hypothetical protein Salat_0644200 [Sesamum alatum]|uniref:Uncharacterized protein n=1 Tax=Sesamum alatum TaxID=300844 RepID=A0AAE1YRQ4_9LAMI|nr:hypothetical protein Salat_0644200 [Sesamum alatum]